MLKRIVLFLAPVLATGVWAAESPQSWPGLPPVNQITEALHAQPRVMEAKAMLGAAQARARSLKAGAYEFNVRLGVQNRSVDTTPDHRYTEWEGALERPLRLPGKAQLDAQLGEARVDQAEMAVGDALHEASRDFLKAWFERERQQASAQLWREQTALLRQQLDIVEKRIKAGDAPRLEREAARAALAQSETQLSRAELARDTATALLKARYPQVSLAGAVVAPEPAQPEGTLESWKSATLKHNHELAWARAVSRAAQISASRMQANLKPDPALGIRYSHERGGEEKVLGAYMTIPLPGQARSAEHDAAAAESSAASIQEAAVAARLAQEAEAQFLAAQHLYQGWQQAKAGAEAARLQAEGMARAYQLGESSLSDTLMARRQAMEAQQAESAARVDAMEAGYRLKLDAHELWPVDEDEARGHEHAE